MEVDACNDADHHDCDAPRARVIAEKDDGAELRVYEFGDERRGGGVAQKQEGELRENEPQDTGRDEDPEDLYHLLQVARKRFSL